MITRTATVTFKFPEGTKPEDADALITLYLTEHTHHIQSYLLDDDGEPKWGRLSHMPALAEEVTAYRTVNLTERLEDARAEKAAQGATRDFSIPA